jgi:hypothetical protein
VLALARQGRRGPAGSLQNEAQPVP